MSQMPKEVLHAQIERIMAEAAPYGEFVIERTTPKTKVVNIKGLDPNEEELKKINEIRDENRRVAITDAQVEWTLQYLVHEGFLINRHDIKDKEQTWRQLTDRGRELKEAGTMEAFLEKKRKEKEYEEEKKQLEMFLLKKHTDIAQDQRAIEGKYRKNTLWISIVAIVVAGLSPVLQHLLDKYDKQ